MLKQTGTKGDKQVNFNDARTWTALFASEDAKSIIFCVGALWPIQRPGVGGFVFDIWRHQGYL